MKISCLIPAYNEATRIAHVLDVVTRHPLIDEIIVVNDASEDSTGEKVRAFPNVVLLEHPHNKGKSNAIYTGLQATRGEYVLFVDADLVGLTEADLTNLINPVINGEADVTISLRGNTPFLWKLIGLDYISGERVLPRKLITAHQEAIRALPGFGLEVFLNKILIQAECRIKVVHWDKVHSPYKRGGYGIIKDIRGNIHMALEVLKNISIVEALQQIKTMMALRV